MENKEEKIPNRELNFAIKFCSEVVGDNRVMISSFTQFHHDELTESEATMLFTTITKCFIDVIKKERIKLEYMEDDLDEEGICDDLFETAKLMLQNYYTEETEED